MVIGGGYGTGRELVEFFLNYGPAGGILGMAVTTIIWSLILAVCFEFVRVFQAYDYRTFFRRLLGPFWTFFELIYSILLFIVLAVCTSVFLAACAASTSPEAMVPSQHDINGVSIYEKYCARCHKPFSATTKANRSAMRLRSAINQFPAMNDLGFLTDEQLKEVASALATTNLQKVSRSY